MEERTEADFLMQELIKRLKKQNKVAKALGQKPTAFHYLLHHAKAVPLKHILAMRLLLNQLMLEEEEVPLTKGQTPLADTARLQLELLRKGKSAIVVHFKAMQAVSLASYTTACSFSPTLKVINTAVYQDPLLIQAEKAYRLPLRTAFIGLLACSDQEGKFYWDPHSLKEAIFPYIPVNFSQLLEALCRCELVQKKELRRKVYGYIPLKEAFLYEMKVKQNKTYHETT